MSVKLWDLENNLKSSVERIDCHTEFVLGIDFSLFNNNLLATCGWDEMVYVHCLPNQLNLK